MNAMQSFRVRRGVRTTRSARGTHRPGRAWRAAAVAATLGCAAVSAHAQSWFQLEAGIGGSAYQRAADGLWVQDGFEHKLNLTAPAIEAGVAFNAAQWSRIGITLHADYIWLATVHTQGLITPDDANYNLKTKGCNGPCWPLANLMTSGHDYGFIFTVEPHYDIGPWRVGVEVGPYLHKSPFSVDVSGIISPVLGGPYNEHFQNTAGWKLGYVIGLNASYRNFGLSYKYFANGGHVTDKTPYPPIWHSTHTLMATYRY